MSITVVGVNHRTAPLDVRQRFIQGIAFCHEFWKQRTRHGIAAFRLPGEYKWNFIDVHHMSNSVCVLCFL